MCNLYKMTNSATEVARHFGATRSASNAGGEVYPGYPALVMADGKLETMAWGFPFSEKSKRTGEPLKPRPVNNARTDKLDGFFWRHSFADRRCLIPLNAWAEAEGPKGGKTRTWQSLADTEIFAVAGIWRDSDEWGRCYSMIMTDAAGPSAEVHDRMPVILQPDSYQTWQEGTPEAARALCQPFTGNLAIDRTNDAWTRR